MIDYEEKRKEIINKLIKDAKLLKSENLFEEDMMIALIEVALDENEKYFPQYKGENENTSVEIMNIIKKKLFEEDKGVER